MHNVVDEAWVVELEVKQVVEIDEHCQFFFNFHPLSLDLVELDLP